MRKGDNLSKDILLEDNKCSHRVIMPLYIPNEDGYYKDSFKIFEYCLQSLNKSSNTHLKISIISNNSCDSVNEKLFRLYNANEIHELIFEKDEIGKINSILKVLRNARERLITITDADVLFCNGWEKAVTDVFQAFPKAGAVCPVPVFRTHFKLTSNIWFDNFFSNKISFTKVRNPQAMTRFANSIGWSWLDEKYKDIIGTVKGKNDTLAVLGCSHFVATYKSEVFQKLPKEDSKFKLGGDSEFLYTDLPILKMDGYRLATYENHAFHMGNTFEDWMGDLYDSIYSEEKKYVDYNNLNILKPNKLLYIVKYCMFGKLFYNKNFKILILKLKGISKHKVKDFV